MCSSVGVIDKEVRELVEFDDAVSVAIELIEEGCQEFAVHAHLKTDKKSLELISSQNTILVQVELTESVSENHLFGLSGGEVEKLGAHGLGQVLDLLSGDSRSLILADVPHRLHHLDEVFI